MTMEGGLSCQTNLQKSTRVFGRGPVTMFGGSMSIAHFSISVCIGCVSVFVGVYYTHVCLWFPVYARYVCINWW